MLRLSTARRLQKVPATGQSGFRKVLALAAGMYGTRTPVSARCFSNTQEVLARLSGMDTCALCDASGKKARVVRGIRPLKTGYHMVGRARTVAIDGDFLEVLAAVHDASAGEVIMIDTCGGGEADASWPRAGGMFGELIANEAARKGVSGMVIDGNCRDTPLLLQMALPVYCRGHHPNAGTANKRGHTQVEIQIGGVAVKPGDYVLGDDDGIVVCSESELEAWLSKAEAIQAIEGKMLSHIEAGRSLFDKLPNFQEHLEAVRNGTKSSLKFAE